MIFNRVRELKDAGMKIGITFSTFDLLHAGHIAMLAEAKNHCDYLSDNKSADFVKAWWAAEQYVPDGIVAGSDLLELVMQPLEKSVAHYPYAGLNGMTGGIRAQEMVVVTAGSGLVSHSSCER